MNLGKCSEHGLSQSHKDPSDDGSSSLPAVPPCVDLDRLPGKGKRRKDTRMTKPPDAPSFQNLIHLLSGVLKCPLRRRSQHAPSAWDMVEPMNPGSGEVRFQP